ncbi:hypothetical protein Q1695_014395 [Nippostrongylus brasiliensis]|nr:hypothetical protein Q1695_014395 [Nippostrongylus brasiliensis]
MLLLAFLLVAGASAEISYVKTGLKKDMPARLRAAQMNPIPLSSAASSMAQGKSFVFSYLNSHLSAKDTSYTENLSLSITNPTDQAASVQITSPSVLFTALSVVVGAGETKQVAITPASMQTDYMDLYLQKAVIENKSIFVTSNATISLVAGNSLSDGGGEDKFAVLPICQLGNEYHVVGDESAHVFQSYQSTNIITVIATQDNTTVQLNYLFTTPTVLQKGQQLTIATYYTQTTIAVTSTKLVAVLSGSVCGFGYYNPSHCSYEVLMLAPSSTWGNNAPYYKFQPEDVGEFMVMFENAATNLYFDGELVDGGPFTHDSYVIVGTSTGMYITANGPIYVVAVGSANSQNQGAPFFANVISSSTFSKGPYTFSVAPTLDEQLNMKHYIRVICSTVNCIGTVKVDNYVPNGLIYTRMGRSNYYFVDVAVTKGQHSVSYVGKDTAGTQISFGVTVYGFGASRAYAFSPGLTYQANGNC